MATIDVTEIIKSSSASSTSFYQPPKKKSRFDTSTNAAAPAPTPDEILAALEDEQANFVALDDAQIRKLVAQLEKKMRVNREQRVKNPDDPKKFMDSEIELDKAIQEMHSLASQPDLYGVFCEANGVEILLQLLGHENTDIVCATLSLLRELTDDDVMNEGEEDAAQLIDSLISGSIISTLLACCERLDESIKDEADGVHNALGVVENMIDFRDEINEECVKHGFVVWLLKRCFQKGAFEANKMYASELLSMILQSSDSAKAKLTEKVDGIDLLLRTIAVYKKNDPSSVDEREYMENLFNSLCAALMFPANRKKFLDGEGLQLMNLMLREKKQSRQSALKVINHATSGEEGIENCNKLVELLGLRTIFPLFMRTPSKTKRKDTTPDEHEEHVCTILSSLLAACSENHRLRIVQKFVEHEHEKVDRAIELFLKYKEKVQRFELKKKRQSQEAGTSEEADPDRDYLDKLDNGLYTLQRLTLILVDVAICEKSARLREEKLFQMKMSQNRLDLMMLPILQEYSDNLGDDAVHEQERVDLMIKKFGEFYA
uniref:Beta-catenin-like protein 1 n=1 Tax=Caenorhabditis japonica TaxID=281687 RepID=A0A8R1E1D7_CAEJA